MPLYDFGGGVLFRRLIRCHYYEVSAAGWPLMGAMHIYFPPHAYRHYHSLIVLFAHFAAAHMLGHDRRLSPLGRRPADGLFLRAAPACRSPRHATTMPASLIAISAYELYADC